MDAAHTPALRARPLPPRSSVAARHGSAIGLFALLIAAAAVRVYGMSDQLVSFDETRQLEHAVGTRALYFSWIKSPLNPRRHVAERTAQRHARIGPPVVEGIAAVGYMFGSGEDLRVARVLGTLFWLIGGGLLFALAASLLSTGTALVAAGFFLLVPHAIVASQAFTPDPLLSLLAIGSWLALAHHDFNPSLGSAALAGLLSGMAVLLDPFVAPVIVVPSALLVARVFTNVETWVLGVLTLAPSAAYYLWNDAARASLLPGALDIRWELWLTPEFWQVWRDRLFDVCRGPYLAALAALGILVAPSNRARSVLWSLTLGYLAYGLAASSRIATLGQTQLLALPLIGLGLASFVRRVWLLTPRVLRPPLRAVVLLAGLALAYWDVREIRAGAWPLTHRTGTTDPRFAEIGELVRHSGQVIVLDPETDGAALEYYGELSGWTWPSSSDATQWRAELDALVHEQGAEYFVSPRTETLTQRPELSRYLSEHYALISKSPHYVVYALR
ncbi:MAG TPA: glycosyltransferase family 39 protein [Polyangiales bacterium]|nr:glycosyltransferase family 39 protein [Polyangiales bacterium]